MNLKIISPSFILRFILFSGILFLLYFVAIGYYIKLSKDETCYKALYESMGLVGFFDNLYQNNCPRPFSNGLILFCIWFEGIAGNYVIVFATIILAHIAASYILIRKLIPDTTNRIIPLSASVFLFIFTILPADNGYFFWINATCTYFLNFTALILLFYAVFFIKSQFLSYLILIMASLYAFSSVENFAICNMVIFGVIILLPQVSTKEKYKIFIALIIGVLSILFFLLAPGTASRKTGFESLTIVQVLMKWPLEMYSFFFWTLPKTFLYYFFLIPVMLFLGFAGKPLPLSNSKLITIIKWSSIALVALIAFSILLNVYAMGSLGQSRTYTNLYFYLIVYIGFTAYIIGSFIKNDYNILSYVTIGTIALFTVNTLDYFRLNIPEFKKYAASYENRMELVARHKQMGDKTDLILPKLYAVEAKPYPINVFNLESDTTGSYYQANTCFESLMGLDFKVYEEK